MLLISEATLRHLQTQVVTAAHACLDDETRQVKISTIEPKQLRMAALIALQIATGDLVLPG